MRKEFRLEGSKARTVIGRHRERRAVHREHAAQRSNWDRLVLNHAEECLRTRVRKRLGDGTQDAQPIQRVFQFAVSLHSVGTEAIVAKPPPAWLVFQQKNATRCKHANHFPEYTLPPPGMVQ